MSTAIVKTQSAIDRLNRSLEKSSLDDLVKARTRRSLLLVDCSDSMNGRIRSGERKITALRSVVKGLRETHPVPVAAFGSGGTILVDEVPEPCGSTPLHTAIEYGRREGATHLVVVTDGQPDSESAAFAEARQFGHPIDVFYIGDGGDSGAIFAAELAKLTGGTVHLTDLGKPKELGTKIAGLLGEGPSLLGDGGAL
jgi:Mg-chelatase subunit ChlD